VACTLKIPHHGVGGMPGGDNINLGGQCLFPPQCFNQNLILIGARTQKIPHHGVGGLPGGDNANRDGQGMSPSPVLSPKSDYNRSMYPEKTYPWGGG
jgi:hypothetical protein